jgi:creatinine amidohydrolase
MEMVRAFQEVSSSTAKQIAAEGALAIWPVGALEQHGPHLPLGTDALVLDAIIAGCREKLGISFRGLFLPTLGYGKSPEHMSFPGTVSLRAETLLAVADDVVASLARHGFKQFVFFNGHGGNAPLLQSYAFDLRAKYDVHVYNLDLWGGGFFREMIAEYFPALTMKEVHAASVETALMQYLFPDLVGEIPLTGNQKKSNGGLRYGWLAEDYNDSGVIGDPSLANADVGEKVFREAVERACGMLRDLELKIKSD